MDTLAAAETMLRRVRVQRQPDAVSDAVLRFLAPARTSVAEASQDDWWAEVISRQSRQPDVDIAFGSYATQSRAKAYVGEDHVALAKVIEAGVLAQGVLDGLVRFGAEASVSELTSIVAEGRKAQERFLLGNLGLVYLWAQRSSGCVFDDRFQFGFFGLHRAMMGWDWRRGYTFATYATHHIRQQIQRGVANEGNIIRVPVHLMEKQADDDLWRRTHMDVSALARDRHNTSAASSAVRALVPWVEWSRVDDAMLSRSDIGMDDIERLQEKAAATHRWATLRRCLDEREVNILVRRAATPAETLDSIGHSLGITRERVRQLERSAVRRCRGLALVLRSASDVVEWSLLGPEPRRAGSAAKQARLVYRRWLEELGAQDGR